MDERAPIDETLDPADWDEYRRLGHRMVDDMLEYLRTVRDRPVWRPVPEGVAASFREPLPTSPSPAAEVYEAFLERVLPYPTGNIHPRFWGWVMGTGTPGAMLAEMLAAGMNLNQGGGAQAGALVERQVIDWCKAMLSFPASASGILVSGGSMANLVGMTVARNSRTGFDVQERRRRPAPGTPRGLRLPRGPQLGAEGDGAPGARDGTRSGRSRRSRTTRSTSWLSGPRSRPIGPRGTLRFSSSGARGRWRQALSTRSMTWPTSAPRSGSGSMSTERSGPWRPCRRSSSRAFAGWSAPTPSPSTCTSGCFSPTRSAAPS